MATNNNMTGSYCLSKKVITSSLLQYVLKMSAPAQMKARICWRHWTLSHSVTTWCRAAHLLLMRHVSSSTSEILVC